MAKWGEGDPRWIVEERPDATNVNNWHWTEKNATIWSKDRLQQLFKDYHLAQCDIECNIERLEQCDGEATVNNRKGKLIFFYEWKLVIKWQGRLLNHSGMYHDGKARIPSFSEESQIDDIDITITMDDLNDESEKIRFFMFNVGREKIRQILRAYIRELKEEYSKNLILPKKDNITGMGTSTTRGTALVTATATTSKSSSIQSQLNNYPNPNMAKIGSGDGKNDVPVASRKIDVCNLNITEPFQCNAKDLYNALTKLDQVMAFTQTAAKVEAIEGGEFQLYDGYIHGTFIELIPEKELKLNWRIRTWPLEHYSTVSIKLEELTGRTLLHLKHSGIPESEYKTMKSNWFRYYWYNIKRTFGFNGNSSNLSITNPVEND